MLPQEIIRIKRDGGPLSTAQIQHIVRGLTDGSVSEGQAAALAMAVFLRGMNSAETVALTTAMRDSGTVMRWDDLGKPVVDKHSTGGIGDNVSLMLAPMLAACGCAVPMISGRGLGHTGGTLDKMESIPGYTAQPDAVLFQGTVKRVGCAIIGQTAAMAPADKRLYAIRDVTATVESQPLIIASILSKKLAAGLQALVMDVKTGNGAFMPSVEDAAALARALVNVAAGAGLATTALVTAMDEPLATCAGHAVEVTNAVDYLAGKHRDARLHEVTLALGVEALLGTKQCATPQAARNVLETALANGTALEKFSAMVHALGGPADFVENHPAYLPRAAVIWPAPAPHAGFVSAIQTRLLGLAVIELGGGRRVASDIIDPSVGLTALQPKGARVDKGEPLGFVHARDDSDAARTVKTIQNAYTVGDIPAPATPLILQRIASS